MILLFYKDVLNKQKEVIFKERDVFYIVAIQDTTGIILGKKNLSDMITKIITPDMKDSYVFITEEIDSDIPAKELVQACKRHFSGDWVST